jgi:hypothetical protein
MSMALRVAQEIRDRLLPPRAEVPTLPLHVREWATDRGEPSLASPVSQLCTYQQFQEPAFAHWTAEMRTPMRAHRKYWEFAYILETLRQHGMLQPGRKGLGFGTGKEPLPAVMARHGVEVLATDLAPGDAATRGWTSTAQHTAMLSDLNERGICDPDTFARLVRLEASDMNAISPDYAGFDFCWSSCALEHLGSINAGLRFIENSLRTLRPGGIAVHTTEYNCSSNGRTVGHGPTVLFRMQDFLRLGERLRSLGHQVRFNFCQGSGEVDRHVDLPPYTSETTLKLRLMRYVTTSIGVIVQAR